jgi:hypothetical protein
MDIQNEKIKLIEWLASLTDQSIIEKLKMFKENFTSGTDWWETISDSEKQSIERGLSDIENGKTLPHYKIMKLLNKKSISIKHSSKN